eukprot:2431639-Ditylum_brightwellii.AAC.1
MVVMHCRAAADSSMVVAAFAVGRRKCRKRAAVGNIDWFVGWHIAAAGLVVRCTAKEVAVGFQVHFRRHCVVPVVLLGVLMQQRRERCRLVA